MNSLVRKNVKIIIYHYATSTWHLNDLCSEERFSFDQYVTKRVDYER